jgi:hypothetical protein
MVKNWMILGDEAFDSNHEPIGVIELTSEELNDWKSVAWERFAHTVNTNVKVREMVFNSNYMYIGAVFNKKSGVTYEDIDGFVNYIFQQIDDIEYYTIDITYNPNADDGKIILNFVDYTKMRKLAPSNFLYIKGDTIVSVHLQNGSYLS